MTLSEMIPTIHALPRVEKLHLIQLLAADVAREDEITSGIANKSVSVWSPFDSFEGAATLLQLLERDQGVRAAISLC